MRSSSAARKPRIGISSAAASGRPRRTGFVAVHQRGGVTVREQAVVGDRLRGAVGVSGSGHLPKLQRDRSAIRARSASFRGRAVTRVAPGIRRSAGQGRGRQEPGRRGRAHNPRSRVRISPPLGPRRGSMDQLVEPWSFQRRVQAGAGMELERESEAAEKEGWRARQSRRRWRKAWCELQERE